MPKRIAAETARDHGLSIILVHPQLGENIGMTARSMLNCGLIDMRLVKPRDNWLNDKTTAAAVGADIVLERAQVFETIEQAIADLQLVYAATARRRDMTKEVVTPRSAALNIRETTGKGGRCGVIFGRESYGLSNDDVALADAVLMVPLNAAFCSLNLAQSVMLVCYEWFQAGDATPESVLAMPRRTRLATKEELIGMFKHLEQELDECGFLRVKEKRPSMVQNLRNIFQRAGMTEQEVRTMRGVISGLTMKQK
ncbi:MAG: rRNA methyltransferase [Rhodospirillales bacterium RIFCSPLOWO2_12_FULL_58_28]|nr:MAG: rRNA methyltransferase [Rhodospirillales bacterium RIFCSPLOWO2_02_FULL_58_16]OHC77713.1 MAG: rRNA methyltransferase [Rhodospirillales bacterium RIFCSPLOWO2_12_FULL_58_28]